MAEKNIRKKILKLRDTVKSSTSPIKKSKADKQLSRSTKKLDKRMNVGLFGLGTKERIKKNREDFLRGVSPKNISDRMFKKPKKKAIKPGFIGRKSEEMRRAVQKQRRMSKMRGGGIARSGSASLSGYKVR
jgi:hypothetical protein|tara:strand:- start:51 stop:443 length:393 start_codon:yes stop_codon:yes gene_type:complete